MFTEFGPYSASTFEEFSNLWLSDIRTWMIDKYGDSSQHINTVTAWTGHGIFTYIGRPAAGGFISNGSNAWNVLKTGSSYNCNRFAYYE